MVILIILVSARLFEAVLLALVPQVGFRGAQIDYFGTTVTVFLHLNTFFAVVSIRNTFSTADDTPALERAKIALVANLDQCAWSHVAVTDDALAITLLAKSTDSDTWLLSAKNQVWMMFCHY